MNHPSDEPQIKRFGKSMPFGHEVFISLNPIVLLADGDIKEMDMVSFDLILVNQG